MDDSGMNKKLRERGSLLCAALSVLAFVLLITMPFSWMIAIIGLAVSVAGIVLSMKSMAKERIRVVPMIGLVVCALSLIALITAVIFLSGSAEPASQFQSSSPITFLN